MIRELGFDRLPQASAVLGRGMRDNPLHIQTFGTDPERRRAGLERMFLPVLRLYHGKGAILGSFDGESLVGVCAMVQPGRCQPGLLEKLRIIPAVLRGNPLGATGSILRWTAAWARHDPREPHWHLGPVAVDQGLQGRGIGSTLMRSFCQRMDATRSVAYLETDKAENVRFYQRFGFAVTAQEDVLGMPNWFMLRPVIQEIAS